MKAADLLDNAEFIGACAAWERDGRAFIGFADIFYARGMVGQAMAWEWAAKHDRRPTPDYDPVWLTNPGLWESRKYRSAVPSELYQENNNYNLRMDGRPSQTFPECIAVLLDRWAEVFGESREPVLTEAANAG